MSKYIIYMLHHDSSDHVYVGKSSNGLARPKSHGDPNSLKIKKHLPVIKWITKRKSLGEEYEILILEELPDAASLNEAERFHIAYFRSIGVPLLNCTDGGEGTPGIKHSPESCAKRSAAQKGRKLSPETLAKLKHTRSLPEVKARMSAAHKGFKPTPETCAKLSAAGKNRKHTEEEKAKISKAHKGKKISPEVIAKVAAANRGKKRSPEVKAKMVAAWTPERREAKAEAQRGREVPQHILDILLTAAKRKKAPEHRAKIGEANHRRVWTPEMRDNNLYARRKRAFPRIRINLLPKDQVDHNE